MDFEFHSRDRPRSITIAAPTVLDSTPGTERSGQTLPLIESIVAIAGPGVSGLAAGTGLGSSAKDLVDFLRNRAGIEDVLARLVEEEVQRHYPRLRHLTLTGEPSFNRTRFLKQLQSSEIRVQAPEELVLALLPALRTTLELPGSLRADDEINSICQSILSSALRGMWKKIGTYPSLTNQIMLTAVESAAASAKSMLDKNEKLEIQVAHLRSQVEELASFAKSAWTQVYDKLSDTAPPQQHEIDNNPYVNPFLLAKAEDFNHNFEKIARLFYGSPEWDSIQRPSDNVVIEGGRGTGKSMLLRRLTAQAALTAQRINLGRPVSFVEANLPYFGVYVKLTRGYYDQIQPSDTLAASASGLLAQHELNIEIFDAFVDTIRWVIREQGLGQNDDRRDLVRALCGLFPKAPVCGSLAELPQVAIQFEQEQIANYLRECALGKSGDYQGSAVDSVTFLRKLSGVFREHLFPNQSIRLFLLIDEFETLLEVQQAAMNTVMKMRLPDLSCKIAVRPSGRKTSDTFTPGDPIQDPRDFTEVTLQYDVRKPEYRELLRGIAEKRLLHAGYPNTDIASYLVDLDRPEVAAEDIDTALKEMWSEGSRRTEGLNDEFAEKYRTAAIYRVLRKMHRRKSYSGFDQFVLLSSGIVSNFIELCKYAFYFALSDQLPLKDAPAIPPYSQTEAAYRVSQRLLGIIGSNVPRVGITLEQLVNDLGEILRSRLLSHPSEPEANRISVTDFDQLSQPVNSDLAKIIDGALVWSVLHLETGAGTFRPRNRGRPPAAELSINRIYCPALGISPRARWRVGITTADLRGLVARETGAPTYRHLMRTIGYYQEPAEGQPGLFPADDER